MANKVNYVRMDSATMKARYDALCREIGVIDAARMDAETLSVVPNALIEYAAGVIEYKSQASKYRNIVPIGPAVPFGKDTVRYTTKKSMGEAAPYTWKAGDNVPMVNQKFDVVDKTLVAYADGWEFTTKDLAAVAFMGENLDASLGQAAVDALERKLDKFAALGDSTLGITEGFLVNSSVHSEPASATIATLIASNPMDAVAELLRLEQYLSVASQGNFNSNFCCMSSTMYGLLARTPISPNAYSNATVLSTFQDMSPYKSQIVQWEHTKTAGSGSTEIISFHDRSLANQETRFSVDQQPSAPEREGNSIKTILVSELTPVVHKEPMASCFATGV